MGVVRFIAGLMALVVLTPPAVAETRIPDATRIVTIGGALTEIVFALGEQDRLIARDTTSVYPEAALALPDVGYMRRLSPEGIMSVKPDLILTEAGAGPPETLEILSNAQIPLLRVPGSYDPQGVMDRVTSVAAALGVEEKGAALVASLRAEFDAIADMVAQSGKAPRVLFVLSMPGGRLNVAGQDTRPDGVLNMAGAVNAAQGFEGYRILTDEALITMAPDAILMMDRGFAMGGSEEELWDLPALKLTPAGRNMALIKMGGAYLLGFGPRMAAAVIDLRKALERLTDPEG